MMAQYPDVFIMTFSIHIPNFVLLSQTAQLLLIFCYAAPLIGKVLTGKRWEGKTDESLAIHQIRQTFPPSKFCTIRYDIYPRRI